MIVFQTLPEEQALLFRHSSLRHYIAVVHPSYPSCLFGNLAWHLRVVQSPKVYCSIGCGPSRDELDLAPMSASTSAIGQAFTYSTEEEGEGGGREGGKLRTRKAPPVFRRNRCFCFRQSSVVAKTCAYQRKGKD